ncbi:ABC transporter permease [Streptomyces sp. NBC_01754]|uniref:ABC transporter permease n=1 Tax=Streptomyces sp. NBC_01754 TaxID=2975930 RepID=UPI002DDB1B84|nr:FtsX-like permease family protein [Streptomyces sp. NBC_01754]WSC94575.1 ABC transporter permease [Streptomyces sp. NBC_01754]
MTWPRDLGLGIRFAAAGGREGWVRTALTAVGVGLGVALLLVASSVPHLLDERTARGDARGESLISRDAESAEKSDTSVLRIDVETEYRGRVVGGYLMRAEGANPLVPPGLATFPGPGEMVASPALKELLASSEGELLRERLPYRITGTIADTGLLSPGELYYYAGSDTLTQADGGHRLTAYGRDTLPEPLSPVLVVLVVIICVVLLVPVAIFIATAVRFGGERRDRRLAALRLVGTDIRQTRRIAAGEALFGSVLGLLVGGVLFLVGRRFVGAVELWNHSAFPSDLTPATWLAALVAVAVPLSAVFVTLAAMRSVVVEPLGVVRDAGSRKRRLWWRLLVPVAGLAVLWVTGRVDSYGEVDPYPIAGGAVLVLFGLALLLPWLVEAAVKRLRGGPPPWQLAVRRLQLTSGAASRAVSGITVAVAGAVALQMMFAAIGDEFDEMTRQDPSRAQFHTFSERVAGDAASRTIEAFRATEGVRAVIGTVEAYASKPGRPKSDDDMQPVTSLTVGDCTTLKEIAAIGSCREGDVFVAHPRNDKERADWIDETARKGEEIELNPMYADGPGEKSLLWTLPADTRTVTAGRDPLGTEHWGILATAGALDPRTLPVARTVAQIRIDESVPDAAEHVRNTAAGIDPGMRIATLTSVTRDRQYASVQTGLRLGAAATLTLIALSMLVTQLEQLRERKRLLSILVAFGTRRATLGWSVLWQTAVPVAVGLLVAVAGGTGLGFVLTWMLDKPVTGWLLFLPLAGAGGGLVVAVTLLSLPLLWRLMRPDGLRTE